MIVNVLYFSVQKHFLCTVKIAEKCFITCENHYEKKSFLFPVLDKQKIKNAKVEVYLV